MALSSLFPFRYDALPEAPAPAPIEAGYFKIIDAVMSAIEKHDPRIEE